MTGDELIALSKERGLIADRLFLMMSYASDGDTEAVMQHLPEHLAYWDEMEQRKAMFVAGPLIPADQSDDFSGEGIVVISAPSYQEAKEIADEDPMHKAGVREFELRPWLLNHMNTDALST
ncbi:MAG: YciI family protein [Acidimicrobiales bacterium]